MPALPRRLRCEPLEVRTAPAAGDLNPSFNGTGFAAALGPDVSLGEVALAPAGSAPKRVLVKVIGE